MNKLSSSFKISSHLWDQEGQCDALLPSECLLAREIWHGALLPLRGPCFWDPVVCCGAPLPSRLSILGQDSAPVPLWSHSPPSCPASGVWWAGEVSCSHSGCPALTSIREPCCPPRLSRLPYLQAVARSPASLKAVLSLDQFLLGEAAQCPWPGRWASSLWECRVFRAW